MNSVNPIQNFLEATREAPGRHRRGSPTFYYINRPQDARAVLAGQGDTGLFYTAERLICEGPKNFLMYINHLCQVVTNNDELKERSIPRLESIKSFLKEVEKQTAPLLEVFKQHLKQFGDVLKDNIDSLVNMMPDFNYSDARYSNYGLPDHYKYYNHALSKELKLQNYEYEDDGTEYIPKDRNRLLGDTFGEVVFYGSNISNYGDHYSGLAFLDPAKEGENFLTDVVGGVDRSIGHKKLPTWVNDLSSFDIGKYFKSIVNQVKEGSNRDGTLIQLSDYIDFALEFVKDFSNFSNLSKRIEETIESCKSSV